MLSGTSSPLSRTSRSEMNALVIPDSSSEGASQRVQSALLLLLLAPLAVLPSMNALPSASRRPPMTTGGVPSYVVPEEHVGCAVRRLPAFMAVTQV